MSRRTEDYLKQYEKQSKLEMYQEARKWGMLAAWDVISRYLNEDDINFMREFRKEFRWYENRKAYEEEKKK